MSSLKADVKQSPAAAAATTPGVAAHSAAAKPKAAAAPAAPMRIWVQTVSAKTLLTLDVTPHTTVGAVKALVEDEMGTAPAWQTLHFAGQALAGNDNRTLHGLGVAHGAVLQLAVDAPKDLFQVFVHKPNGATMTLDLYRTMRVDALYALVADEGRKHDPPVLPGFVLVFRGVRLLDGTQTMAQCNIINEDTLYVVARARNAANAASAAAAVVVPATAAAAGSGGAPAIGTAPRPALDVAALGAMTEHELAAAIALLNEIAARKRPAAKAAPPKPPAAPTHKTCERCTFDNHLDMPVCETCGGDRFVPATAALATLARNGAAGL